jgi:pimeloyl-ACP methyl ester carboxylesterase
MHITTNGARIWVHQQGDGVPLLLIGGTSDPAESWQAQIDAFGDRYHVIAPDNRGAGRSPLPADGASIESMAEDAAGVLRELGVGPAHVAGFSMGGAIAQELVIAHPELVRSVVLSGTYTRPTAYFHQMVSSWIALADTARSEREMLEAFFLWIYSRGAHEDGTVASLIDEALVSPLAQEADAFLAQAQACIDWKGAEERLAGVRVPALVVVGDEDIACPPDFSQVIVDALPDAELVVIPGGAHQPFQELPQLYNAVVGGFWERVERSQGVAEAA